jgi:hypothetical protein
MTSWPASLLLLGSQSLWSPKNYTESFDLFVPFPGGNEQLLDPRVTKAFMVTR